MFRAGFEPGSSWVRVVSNKFKEIFPLIQYLICLETNSKPTRSVRMQWSISLMVFTTPPSGFVNAPDGARECTYIFVCVSNRVRIVFDSLRPISTPFDLFKLYSNLIQRDISFDMAFDMSRIQIEPGSKRSNAME